MIKTIIFICSLWVVSHANSNKQDLSLNAFGAMSFIPDFLLLNLQYQKELSAKQWLYMDVLISDAQESYDDSLTSKTEHTAFQLYQFGLNFHPWSEESGIGVYFLLGLGLGQTYFKSLSYEESKWGLTAIGGLGYQNQIGSHFLYDISIKCNLNPIEIKNPNQFAGAGGLDGTIIPPIIPAIYLGYRF